MQKVLRCVQITPEKFENARLTGHFGFVFDENSGSSSSNSSAEETVFRADPGFFVGGGAPLTEE